MRTALQKILTWQQLFTLRASETRNTKTDNDPSQPVNIFRNIQAGFLQTFHLGSIHNPTDKISGGGSRSSSDCISYASDLWRRLPNMWKKCAMCNAQAVPFQQARYTKCTNLRCSTSGKSVLYRSPKNRVNSSLIWDLQLCAQPQHAFSSLWSCHQRTSYVQEYHKTQTLPLDTRRALTKKTSKNERRKHSYAPETAHYLKWQEVQKSLKFKVSLRITFLWSLINAKVRNTYDLKMHCSVC